MIPAQDGAGEEELAAALDGLANPMRIRLMRLLLSPKPLGEIELRAGGVPSERALARQTIRGHLDKLLEAGLVVARPSEDDRRSPAAYVVNQPALFALSEEIRLLAHLRPAVEPAVSTVHAAARGPASEGRGPRLLLVRGVGEGRAFPLRSARPGPAQWTIGRSRSADVPLDFDPYVSAENSRVVRRDGALLLEDLPSSRNGTSLNFEPLPRGGLAPLRHGDLVGVGRTVLAYREA